MEGPTPVSALIHAATMVTAGVYLVARMPRALRSAPARRSTSSPWSARHRALRGARSALVQTDIKKVLAYSTVSQLGFMFVGVGVGAYAAGVFHLFTHAFFKALPVPRRRPRDPRARRRAGHAEDGRPRAEDPASPRTRSLIATAGDRGHPPARRLLLEGRDPRGRALRRAAGDSSLLGAGRLGAALTAFYMFRLLFLTFFGRSRVDHDVEHHVHESPPVDDDPARDPRDPGGRWPACCGLPGRAPVGDRRRFLAPGARPAATRPRPGTTAPAWGSGGLGRGSRWPGSRGRVADVPRRRKADSAKRRRRRHDRRAPPAARQVLRRRALRSR